MSHQTTVIFSIDSPSRPQLKKFLQFCSNHSIKERITPLIGCYKGEEEPAFITSQRVFREYISNSGFVDNQESFLTVTGCNKAYAVLVYRVQPTPSEGLGSMCQVSEAIARTYPAWTYRPDTKAWYIAHKSNPDHSKDIGPYTGS